MATGGWRAGGKVRPRGREKGRHISKIPVGLPAGRRQALSPCGSKTLDDRVQEQGA